MHLWVNGCFDRGMISNIRVVFNMADLHVVEKMVCSLDHVEPGSFIAVPNSPGKFFGTGIVVSKLVKELFRIFP